MKRTLRSAGIGAMLGAIVGLLLGLLAPFWSPQLLTRAPEGATWIVIELTIVVSCGFGGIAGLASGFFPNGEG